jgi:hypothetical protein
MAAREVDETDAGHFRSQIGARGISSVENLERHGFESTMT